MDSKPISTQNNRPTHSKNSRERIIEFKSFGRKWHLRVVPAFWLIMSFILALTVSLGFWQLDRMHQKEAILSQIQTSKVQQHVTGRFRSPLLYLDNITNNGRVGYELIAPFKLKSPKKDTSQLILVNIGWIASGQFRDQLPSMPFKQDSLYSMTIETAQWSTRSPSVNIEHMPSEMPSDVYRIQALTPSVQSLLDVPKHYYKAVEGDATLITQHWQQQADHLQVSPKRHLGYAIQWFSTAIVAFVILITSSVSIVSPLMEKTNE